MLNVKRLFVATVVSLSLCPIAPMAWAITPQEVEAYNNQIDADYEKAVQTINEANEKIKAYNQAEEERVKREEEYNRQAQEQANLRNAEIDQLNANEKVRVEQENQRREEQYTQDMAQYEEDYAQYQKDLAVEEKIKAAGYESVEQYNDMINTRYNEPADLSVEKNAAAQAVSIDQTYEIVQGTPSGRKIPVHIEHVFLDTSITYSTDFEIDANDTITLKGVAAAAETVEPGSCIFYYNTDSDHSMGYWMNSYSRLLTNPTATVSDGWDCGDTHTVTYADSTNEYSWNFEDISITYEYSWQALRKYKTYNVPVEPIEPTLELEEYVPIPYVEPTFIEVVPANIQALLPLPTKGEYLKYELDPVTTTIISPAAVPATVNTLPAIYLQVNETENVARTVYEIAPRNESAPLLPNIVYQRDDKTPQGETIKDNGTPLAQPQSEGRWALVNLIAMVLTILPLIKLARKDDEENDNEDEDNNYRYKDHNNIFGVILALGSVLLFIFTENVRLPMGLVDIWTIPMILLCGGGIVARILTRTTKEEEEESEN